MGKLGRPSGPGGHIWQNYVIKSHKIEGNVGLYFLDQNIGHEQTS